jgi:hypothetical protein
MKSIDEARSLYWTYMSELNNHELAILCCKIALDKIFQVCDVSVEHHWHEVYEHIESFENE